MRKVLNVYTEIEEPYRKTKFSLDRSQVSNTSPYYQLCKKTAASIVLQNLKIIKIFKLIPATTQCWELIPFS